MNKAAFLNIIRQVAPIQDQEVEDLEELVASFPYCQTAHILLAKAAYDRGSMLSTQKLRRAAAHASNRQLLKRIVYAPPILQTMPEEDVAVAETPSVFGQFPGIEAKNAFPEVAPEEGILEAIENLSEEDIISSEVEAPYEVEEPEEKVADDTFQQETALVSLEEEREAHEPTEDTLTLEAEDALEEEGLILEEDYDQYTIAGTLVETQAEPVALHTLEDAEGETPIEEEQPIEELNSQELETQEITEPLEADFDGSDSNFKVEDIPTEDAAFGILSEADAVSEEEAFAGAAIQSEESQEEDTVEAIIPIEAFDTALAVEAYAEAQEQPSEELEFDPLYVEALLAESIPGEISSSLKDTENPAFASEFLAAALDSLEDETTVGNFPTKEESLELTTKEEVQPGLNNTIEEEGFTEGEKSSLPASKPVSEEDELFSLIQIDSLATLTAPIPSVNLTHAEIISELTSKPEAPALLTLEEVLPEAASDLAPFALAIEDTNAEETDLVVEPSSVGVEPASAGLEKIAFPMLQPAAAMVHEPEQVTEKDPYLSIFYHNSLAYWMDSSRLGETIQLRDELTSRKPYYFQPDLILEHVKGNGAIEQVAKPVAKLDVQLTIIDQFLKSNPKLKSMAHLQQKNEPQEDLSAKSSKIKKNLASENLALIFVKQGKIKKAVKIYEQLIVKFPEKKSYFAEQIDKLRNEL